MNGKHHRIGIIFLVSIFSMLLLAQIASALELNIVFSTGQALKITANPDDTVRMLKKKIFDITEISYLNQALYKGNKVLKDDKTLASYSLKDGDTLNAKIELQKSSTSKPKKGLLPIVILIVIILAIGIYFMRKIPSHEYKP